LSVSLLDGLHAAIDAAEAAGNVKPAPEPPVPLVVGGRSDAALRRAGRLGMTFWCAFGPDSVSHLQAVAATHARQPDSTRRRA
jgi:alkanesulfonate monooxygenase SsuD/methylene tetrahydromethanopterin reductase-like flavin-dependent oxidoreductase (luciferase family)